MLTSSNSRAAGGERERAVSDPGFAMIDIAMNRPALPRATDFGKTPRMDSPTVKRFLPWVVAMALFMEQLDWTLEKHAYHYVRKLSQDGKSPNDLGTYHSMLGGIGHALVHRWRKRYFFHSIARQSQTQFEIKGENPLTENYSILRPEVLEDFEQRPLGQKNTRLIKQLLEFDTVIIGGQAKSHCVAWTIDDLLTEIKEVDATLAQKIYLLEDCTSPVVVPNTCGLHRTGRCSICKVCRGRNARVIKSSENIALFNAGLGRLGMREHRDFIFVPLRLPLASPAI